MSTPTPTPTPRPTPGVFRRLVTKVGRLFAGQRVNNAGVVNGTADELRKASLEGKRTESGEFKQLVTPLMTSYLAAWAFPRLTSRAAAHRKRLRTALARTRDNFLKVSVSGESALADLDLPGLRAEYEKVTKESHSQTTAIRSHHLGLFWYLLAAVTVFIVDSYFFYGIIMDANDASESNDDYALVQITSAFFALASPLTVILISEFGGRRIARLRVELRQQMDADPRTYENFAARFRDIRSMWAAPAIIFILLGFTLTVFWNFAQHRFDALVNQVGSVGVDPFLLAVLITMLPVITFMAAVFHHDVPTKHRKKVEGDWARARDTMTRHQNAVREAMFEWTQAWMNLRDVIGRITAEANVSMGTWEHLILLGIAKSNQAGETAIGVNELLAEQQEAPALANAVSPSPTERSFSVPEILQMKKTKFAAADWVLDEILIDIEALSQNAPTALGITAEEITRLLAFGLEQPDTARVAEAGVETTTAGVPVDEVAAPGVETAELEAMLVTEQS